MQIKFKILTLLRNDAPRDAIQRIQRHFRGLIWAECAEWAECAD